MTGGTICIDRALFDHPVVGIQQPDMFIGWLWLLKEAGWQDRRKSIKGRTIAIKRGQVAHSVRFMAKGLGWSRGKTERFIIRLKTETMIETETGTGQNIITICNYDKYQLIPGYNGTETETASGTAAGQERDRSGTNYNTLNALNTLNTKKEAPVKKQSPAKRGTRLSKDWVLPDSWAEWAKTQGHQNPQREAEKFKDYWIAATGRGSVKLDWEATWRNWIRRAMDDNRGGGNGVSRSDASDTDIEELSRRAWGQRDGMADAS